MMMPSSIDSSLLAVPERILRRAQLPYAREPPAIVTTTTSAPSSARNSSMVPFPLICAAISFGMLVNAV